MKAIFEFIFKVWFNFLGFINALFAKNKYLYFIDIDNTLADTYPSLSKAHRSEKDRLLNLKPHTKIINILINSYAPSNRKLVFITARSYKQYFTTIKWLNNNGLKADIFNTIMVKHPKDKINLIQKYYLEYKTIVIDDLSYNHEHGCIRFYENEISQLKKLKLKHIGYSTILKLQMQES
ncbi:MAG: hypothetical protein V9G42_12995 [Bacteroidia bacterium]